MSDLSDIVSVLRRCTSFVVSVHKSPDGDALGSQLALMIALQKTGKTVVAQNIDPVPEIYRFLPGWEKIKVGSPVDGRYDCAVVLDCEPARTGLFDKGFPVDVVVNIDHHVTNPRALPLTWVDTSASATGEMIYEIIQALQIPFDRDVALCLYTSIFTDTGSFRYTNTTARCMHRAAEMIEAGADPWLVTENVYESFAYRRLKLLGSVLAGIERSDDGRIAWVVVTEELFRQNRASAEDTDNFINFVRATKGVEVAVLFRQTTDTQYKISLRSKGRVDLSELARSLGGGGHKNAAGAVLNGTLQSVKNRVISEVDRVVIEQIGNGNPDRYARRS